MTQFQPDARLFERTIGAFGLGVAQGDNDVVGEGAINIVLLFGHR